MRIDEIFECLRGDDSESKVELLRKLSQWEPRRELFEELLNRLHDRDDRVRFLAFTILIRKLGADIAIHSARLIPIFIELLADESPLVVDRAMWALNIAGSKSVEALLEALQSKEPKAVILVALGRNTYLAQHKEKVLEALFLALEHKQDSIRGAAMCALMDRSPVRQEIVRHLPSIDFDQVYEKVLPIAEAFIKNEKSGYQEWGSTYKELIEQYLKNKSTY